MRNKLLLALLLISSGLSAQIVGTSGPNTYIRKVNVTTDADSVLVPEPTSRKLSTLPKYNLFGNAYNFRYGGASQLYYTGTKQGNISLGYQSLRDNANGEYNIAIGQNSLLINEGEGNVAIGGFGVMANQTAGNYNIAIGYARNQAITNGSNQLNIAGAIWGTGVNDGSGASVSNGNLGFFTNAPARNIHLVGTGRWTGLGAAVADTNAYKSLVVDANGDIKVFNRWPGAGGVSGDTATNQEVFQNSTINLIGNSLVDLSPNWVNLPNQFRTITGYRSNNLGITGQTTTQIKARFDAVPAAMYNQPWIIEGGRNDITQNGYGAGVATTIKSNIAAMVATLTAAGNNKYLIMGVVPSNSETTGSSGGTFVSTLNSDLATLYGTRFVNIGAALQANGDGSANDNADIAAGIMPRSKMYDAVHPNTAGVLIEANTLAAKIDLLVPNPNRVLTLKNLGAISGQNQPFIGTTTGGRVLIGDYSLGWIPNQISSGALNSIVVGSGAKNMAWVTGTNAQNNTIVGMQTANALTTGQDNTMVGTFAGFNATTASSNVAVGSSAALGLTTGGNNTAVGENAARGLTTGGNNIMLGSSAGRGVTTGSTNFYAGQNSGFANTAGNNNVGLGVSALQNLTGGNTNVAVGVAALKGTANSASNNVAVGTDAGTVITTGSNNIFLGHKAGEAMTSGSKNIVIGYDIDAASNTASNTLNIANYIYGLNMTGSNTTVSTGQLGLGVAAPTASLHLPAGTATASTAPLKFSTGTFNTSTEIGAVEFNGTALTLGLAAGSSSQNRGKFQVTRVIEVSASTTFTIVDEYSDYVYTHTSSAGTFTLPSIANAVNSKWEVKNASAFNLTVQSNAGGSDLYSTSAVASIVLTPGQAYTFTGGPTKIYVK